jgi:hypothetical protein
MPRAKTRANGTGAIKKQQSGTQSNDEAIPIAAATRGNKNVRTMAKMKRRVPSLKCLPSIGFDKVH